MGKPMTTRRRLARRVSIGLLVIAALLGATWLRDRRPRPITVNAGRFPEELVYARSTDDVVNGGVLFTSSRRGDQSPAVIWVHGWGVNFYSPTYTAIGRALAARGTTMLSVNTRMHDIGTSATYRGGRRVRGGGYWGIQSEQDLDIAAWVDFAAQHGYPEVVLAGHSAGWAAVAAYRVRTQDPRVVGVVLASGAVGPLRPQRDPDLLAQARRLVDAGTGDDLIRLPNRNFPSFISAANLLDQANTPAALLDFFGVEERDPGVARLGCPILAFFGTRGDVGGEDDLEVIRSAPRRLSIDTLRVEAVMIDGADHMYTGEEARVAGVIGDWVRRVVVAGVRR